MPQENPRLKVSCVNDVTVVELTDHKILDEVNIRQIGEQLRTLAGQSDQPKILLDFSSVVHLSSSALGMLITLHKRIRDKNGELRLCCISAVIYEVFVITRLNEIFRICKTRSEAMESFEG